tara:strand:- start:351 stop:863 length:513 start_codon:yes stop_codon:yes gene_type:complete
MNEILIIPNTILRNRSDPIKEVSDIEIKLSKKMRKIMNEAPGVGLAAPQLGVLKRIITINVRESSDEKNLSYTLFNPEIISYSKNKVIMEEGCLSVPRQFAEIERPEKIHFKYLNDKNMIIEKEAVGNESRVIQHEIDHLEGKLFIDYLSSLKRNIVIKKVQKLKKLGEI